VERGGTPGLNSSAMLYQHLGNLKVSCSCSGKERHVVVGGVGGISCLDISTMLGKHFDNLEVTFSYGGKERTAKEQPGLIFVGCFNIRSMPDKQSHNLVAPGFRRLK